MRGAEAVVHAAAIPDPTHNPPHVVFQNNLMATFNLVEAAVALGVRRIRSRRRTRTRSRSTSASS